MVEFFTSSGKARPVRLSEATRRFAYESLNDRKYGKDTQKNPFVSLDHIVNYSEMDRYEKYNTAIYEIVTKAPIRICEGELLSGAATLGDAMRHLLPAFHKDEKRGWWSGVSHLTADFFEVLEIGMDGVREKTEKSLKKHTDPEKIKFLESCLHCIDCMKLWHSRYTDALEGLGGYEKNLENLRRVPFGAAGSFYEAVQSLWFCFAFVRLTGCWPGIGRIDVLLGKYLKADLEKGIITLDEAREILAHFFIKGCEWITGDPVVSGDAQHYQNIVLSGIDSDGNDVTNEVTYLVLDIIEETGIGDFPTTVRIGKNTDPKLLRRTAEVIKCGGGAVAVYNEELIIASLCDMGYELREARCFANDGCWEVQIPGKTNFGYLPFDGFKLLCSETLGDFTAEFGGFEELYRKYTDDLRAYVGMLYEKNVLPRLNDDLAGFKPDRMCTVISLFEQSCIEKGLSYKEGGAVYYVLSPHIGGLTDAVNSLYAIKKAVFDDKLVGYGELMNALKNNWEGHEELRLRILGGYDYFGNGNDEVDEIYARLLGDFSDMCLEYDKKSCFRFVSGVSTFGRQIEWSVSRPAAPFGRRAGEVLSGNSSPTPGTDKNGATAVVRSYCKADLRRQYTGAALDIGLTPQSLGGENADTVIEGLIKSFVILGGYFMQIDTVDRATLLDAQAHPENYSMLSVRVSGWNARFVTMNKEWQDMIIERTKK